MQRPDQQAIVERELSELLHRIAALGAAHTRRKLGKAGGKGGKLHGTSVALLRRAP